MEKQLTTEEVEKVFTMYWLQKAQRFDRKTNRTFPDDWCYVNASLMKWFINNEKSSWHYKLLLTPLPDITDEHAVEVAKIFGGSDHISDESKIHQTKDLIATNSLFNQQTNISGSRWMYVFQYLIQKGYAVPLFFGINHWANKQTAIELGIAIDVNNQQ